MLTLSDQEARGESDGESDIDLVVDCGGQRLSRVFGLGGAVEALTGKNVDVYVWSELLPGPSPARWGARWWRCEGHDNRRAVGRCRLTLHALISHST